MAENTAISWATHTANFFRGCSHATYTDSEGNEHAHPGCLNCYAQNQVDNVDGKQRFKLGLELPIWGQGENAVRIMGKTVWGDVRKWNRQASLQKPHKSDERYPSGEFPRPRIFVGSLMDFFEDFDGPVVDSKGQTKKIDESFERTRRLTIADLRLDAFKLIDECQNLDFLITTKRPQNIQRFWEYRDWQKESSDFEKMGLPRNVAGDLAATDDGVRDNVWLQVSVSDQPTTEWALRELAKTPKWWRHTVLSAEPMLGEIDLMKGLRQVGLVDQIIIGGESTQQFPARPFPVDAAKRLVEQCQNASLPVWFKQFGSNPRLSFESDILNDESRTFGITNCDDGTRKDGAYWRMKFKHPKGEDIEEFPSWARLRQTPAEVNHS